MWKATTIDEKQLKSTRSSLCLFKKTTENNRTADDFEKRIDFNHIVQPTESFAYKQEETQQ
jgi:hypothetical protein